MSVRVYLRHARALSHGRGTACAEGIREFCSMHGISFQDLRTVGVPAEQLAATGSAQAMKAIALATEEAAQNG